MKHVYFAMLVERSLQYEAVNAFAEICAYLGSQPTESTTYHLLTAGYQPVDSARNYLTFKFLEQAISDDDTLVMLDNDHIHPVDTVERLARRDKPVVGALAFKRKEPYFPIAYVRDPRDNRIKIPLAYPSALCKVSRVGGAALAIQKQVFDKLSKKGYHWPYFRFTYQDWDLYKGGEDVNFMAMVEACGVPIYCDMTLVTPHLDTTGRDGVDWQRWQETHPNLDWNGQSIRGELITSVPEKYIKDG